MIKGPIYQEAIVILNAYIPNDIASKYLSKDIEMLKLKGEKINSKLIIVEDFKTPLSGINKVDKNNH